MRSSRSAALALAMVASFLLQAKPAFNPPAYYAAEKSIEVQGVNTIYLDQGSGKTVLFIHGFCGNAFNWSDVFFPLSKEFRVIVPDLPGYGKSACPGKQKHMMIWYADFLAEFLDRLGVEKAVVVGNSMGGSIAAWMAIRHPDKVEKLVLEDSAGTRGGMMGLLKGVAQMTPSPMIIPLLHVVFPVDPEKMRKTPVSEQKRVEVAEARYNSELAPCSSRAMKSSAVSLGQDLPEKQFGKIAAPTLIIWGDNDDLLEVKTAEKFHQKIPGSRVEIIQGGVHTPMQWKPEEFMKVLRAFISEN